MVEALHAAGIEVLLDVVLNHTGEGDAGGPTLSLRGLDNATYYRQAPGSDGSGLVDVNDTGCGNTLALDRPPVLRLAMDALRHWASATGIDGFRFDLATTLGRRAAGFDPAAPLLAAIEQDPELRALKLVAEPWDVGPGGYQLGAFPPAWGEWNDRYRDGVRRFWRGDRGTTGELATRIAGSGDILGPRARPPSRSVNFVTAHDGFTLADLVAYAGKHNAANGEGNRDGTDANYSWNHGVEGPTDDPAINAARARQRRNFMATLFLSQGVPMIVAGDEIGSTRGGNNNPYCQDNETNWLDWTPAADKTEFLKFVRLLVAFRQKHPVLRRRRFFQGREIRGAQVKDLYWHESTGREMADAAWNAPNVKCFGVTLVGDAIEETDAQGGPIVDDTLMILLNAQDAPVPFVLPGTLLGARWARVFDTAGGAPDEIFEGGAQYPLADRAIAVLKLVGVTRLPAELPR